VGAEERGESGVVVGMSGGARCLRCNHQLTNTVSISRGFGPVCWLKVREEIKSRMKPLKEVFDEGEGTTESRT